MAHWLQPLLSNHPSPTRATKNVAFEWDPNTTLIVFNTPAAVHKMVHLNVKGRPPVEGGDVVVVMSFNVLRCRETY